MILPPGFTLVMAPTKPSANGTVHILFVPCDLCMEEHLLQKELVVKPAGYPPEMFL